MLARAAVDRFVESPAFALVGASRSGRKFGNLALRTLRSKGYRVYPIHPSADSIDGVAAFHDFNALPEHVDAALVVVPPEKASDVVKEAAAAGVRRVWLQQGAESPEVLALCQRLGIEAVSGECILMFARPSGYHKFHGWLWRMMGRAPHAVT